MRRAPKDGLIIADGFSCRTQISQTTDRRAMHLADVIDMAEHGGESGPRGDYPERRYVPDYGAHIQLRPATIGAAVVLAGGLLAVGFRRRRRERAGG